MNETEKTKKNSNNNWKRFKSEKYSIKQKFYMYNIILKKKRIKKKRWSIPSNITHLEPEQFHRTKGDDQKDDEEEQAHAHNKYTSDIEANPLSWSESKTEHTHKKE